GHNVTLATPGEYFRRPELKLSFSKIDYYNREPWYPARASIVFVDTVVFGITIYESTEEAEVTSDWSAPIRYSRVSASPTKRKSRYAYIQTTQKQFMPSGRLSVRAYSPYGGVEWQQTWQEKNVGELCQKI